MITIEERVKYMKLGMEIYGISVDEATTELILRLNDEILMKGGEFNLEDSVRIEYEVKEKYNKDEKVKEPLLESKESIIERFKEELNVAKELKVDRLEFEINTEADFEAVTEYCNKNNINYLNTEDKKKIILEYLNRPAKTKPVPHPKRNKRAKKDNK